MRWDTEELFEKHYFTCTDPTEQVKDLANWRRQQLAMVGKLKDISCIGMHKQDRQDSTKELSITNGLLKSVLILKK